MNPANGHYYEAVDLSFPPRGAEWPEANDLANEATFMGVGGHLVTITSQAEQDFIENHVLTQGREFTGYWLGAMQLMGQASPDVGWQWVTGEPFVYTNWSPGAPCDNPEPEEAIEERGRAQFIELRAPPGRTTWNDNGVRRKSYIIEYPLSPPDDCEVTEAVEVTCNDESDNDCDGAIDCADEDCDLNASCSERIIHFEDDFEQDKGYVVGQHLGGTNGWEFGPGSFAVPIGENEPGLDGQYADGLRHIRTPESPTRDAGVVNDANIKDGLDPTRIYTLEWDWKIYDLENGHTHNTDIGFRCWGGVIGAYAEIPFIRLIGLGGEQFLFPFPETGPEGLLQHVKLVVSPEEIYAVVDGVESTHIPAPPLHFARIDGIVWGWDGEDPSDMRTAPQIDNIVLSSTCAIGATCPEVCGDGQDNDEDGDIDCADADCQGDPSCPEICNDEEDNDGDGQIDCADSDCTGEAVCPEVCTDFEDNDGDGDVDCADADCQADTVLCPPEAVCDDGLDNDLDGDIDCVDTDCAGEEVCPEICDDGQDNDGDGKADCADADCRGNIELCPPEGVCDDGQDNDFDGDVDCADENCEDDPGCPRSIPSGFRVDFNGKPAPPFVFNNEFLWDDSEPGLARMKTNQGGDVQQELKLDTRSEPNPIPAVWDPSVPGSYEVRCMVLSHTAGLGAGALDMFYADTDWSWTITWTEFFVSLDIQFEQIEVPQTADDYSFEMDTTDDFHCYRVDWDPTVPIATLFVDGEDTGIFLDIDLLANSRGRTELVLGDAYSGTTGGEIIFDRYSFEPAEPLEVCDDGLDNDGDEAVDCADTDCVGNAACPEVCDDGLDNDGDEAVDCADTDCVGDAACPELCDDGLDNDGDEAVDCADADCVGDAACPSGVGPFLRGDCDGNGSVGGSPTEAIVLLNFAFRGGNAPGCLAACDAEANGSIGITDALRILRHAFLGFGVPDPPFPDCVKSDAPTDQEIGCEVPFCP